MATGPPQPGGSKIRPDKAFSLLDLLQRAPSRSAAHHRVFGPGPSATLGRSPLRSNALPGNFLDQFASAGEDLIGIVHLHRAGKRLVCPFLQLLESQRFRSRGNAFINSIGQLESLFEGETKYFFFEGGQRHYGDEIIGYSIATRASSRRLRDRARRERAQQPAPAQSHPLCVRKANPVVDKKSEGGGDQKRVEQHLQRDIGKAGFRDAGVG